MSFRAQIRVVMTATLVVVSARAGSARAQDGDVDLGELEERAFRQAAAAVSPSIVRIQTVGGLDRVGRVLTGTGPTTGVVVDPDGYIVSSAFNFASKPSSILVQLPDERRFTAEVVATDRSKMLTLLKIDAEELLPPPAAPGDEIRVGDWAVALGATYDPRVPSISVGIVSALDRIWGKAIQTDAKVSPVNYGGPLVDVRGRVQGILVPLSTRGTAETAGVEWYDSGIGFAIPMEDVYTAVERLKKGEDLHPGLIGVNLEGRGLLAGAAVIDRVRVESPADRAGLKKGDVIVEADGRPIGRQAHLKHVLGKKYAGDSVALKLERGEEAITVELTLVEALEAYQSGFLGILPFRGEEAQAAAGVPVRYVYPDSPAAEAGLQTRDRIVRFDGQAVTDAAALTDLVGRRRPTEKVELVFLRDDAETTAEVELAALPDDVPTELRSSAIPVAEEPAGDEAPQTGRFTVEMPAHEHSYWGYVPDDYNADFPYALMVWIHPGGDTMEAAVIKDWQTICSQRGILILAPKAEKIAGWNLNEADFVKDAVEDFTGKYSVDPRRVFLHGHSDGGTFAYHLVFKYRDVFAGAAVTAQPLRARPPENDPDFRQQFHLLCGRKDNLFPIVQRTALGLRRLKFPVSFTAVPELDHAYPAVDRLEEIGRWADCLDRI